MLTVKAPQPVDDQHIVAGETPEFGAYIRQGVITNANRVADCLGCCGTVQQLVNTCQVLVCMSCMVCLDIVATGSVI